MRREQLEHVLRAASTVVGERDILVIGSQAVLASVSGRPKDLAFARALLRKYLVDARTLVQRIDLLPVPLEARTRLRTWVEAQP